MLALKRNQPILHDEVERYFADPATTGLQTIEIADKDHGRVEVRTYAVSHDVAWLNSDRRYPGEYRFGAVKSLVKTTTSTHWRGKTTCETRYFISSAVLPPERAAEAIRALLARPGQAMAKERLFELVFPGEVEVQPEAIEVVAYRLRKKIALTGAQLVTLRGLGFLLKVAGP